MSESVAETVIDLQHVNVMRGAVRVLHDINLHIAAGESLAILGPNGCGKSTLLKTLTCELYPLAEPQMRVSLFGRPRWDVTELRRRMGMVSSDPPPRDAQGVPCLEIVLSGFFSAARLWPHLNVTDDMRTLAWRAMADAGVQRLADRPLQTLSSGQQKRVMIARALAASGNGDRRMLLLDEPSNTLDLAAQRELRITLQRLAEQGTGVILITHHVEDLVPAMGRVLLMQDGQIIADGATQHLVTQERLSALFETPLTVSQQGGHYIAR